MFWRDIWREWRIFTLFVLDRNEYRSQQVVPFCDQMFGLGAADRLGVDLGALGETFGMGLMRPIGLRGLMS